jgi:hypothetical protein
LPTTANILALNTIPTGTMLFGINQQQRIDLAINWLLTQRNSDGGFGSSGVSAILETALVYQVLAANRPGDPATGAALDFLVSHQTANGTWGGEALQTAATVNALPAPATSLIDTDKDGIPDALEVILGTNPNVPDSRYLADRGLENPGPPPGGVGISAPMLLASPSSPGTVAPAPSSIVLGNAGSTTAADSASADGDLNEDGIVDAADVALAEQIALGQLHPSAGQLGHGDISPPGNPDGVIDAADVALIRLKALGGGF